MILLRSNLAHKSPRVVGVLGLGLIGRAIVESLRRRGFEPFHFQKLRWVSQTWLREDLLEASGPLLAQLSGRTTADAPLPARRIPSQLRPVCELIWCAGRAGFAASEEEVDQELGVFDTVLRWAEEVATSQGIEVCLSMISSAGGLYEGQQRVDLQSPCRPCRPYGWLKLNQERRLRESPSLSRRRVFRPSSIYGWLRSGQRKGLIPTLISNGLRNQETSLNGSLSTLRDYVWVDDVAEIVARSLFRESATEPDFSTRLIASGQPCSIFQIKHLVEATIGRRVQLRFLSQASNALDTTFSTNGVGDNGSLTSMSVAIRRISADFSSKGVCLDVRRPTNGLSQGRV